MPTLVALQRWFNEVFPHSEWPKRWDICSPSRDKWTFLLHSRAAGYDLHPNLGSQSLPRVDVCTLPDLELGSLFRILEANL